MNKKWTIIAVAALALMLAGIAYAVYRLYQPDAPRTVVPARVGNSPLSAIPSDAAALLVLDGSRTARRVAADSIGLLRPFLCADNASLMSYLDGVSKYPTVVSLHNSGALIPLVASAVPQADSTTLAPLYQLASQAGLKTAFHGGFLLSSPSEPLVQASVRHLDDGISILQSEGLVPLISGTGGAAALYLCHQQAPKLLQIYTTAQVRRRSEFVRDIARWSAFDLSAWDDNHLILKGAAAPAESAGSFFDAFRGFPSAAPHFAEVVPYFTELSVSLPVGDVGAFVDRYREYLDAKGRLNAYNKALTERSGRPMSPLDWARDIQIREVAKAVFQLDGERQEALFVRTGKDLKAKGMNSNVYRGALGRIFGEAFAVTDTAYTSAGKNWTVFSSGRVIQAWCDGDLPVEPLSSRLSDSGITLPEGFVVYASLSDAPGLLRDVFSAPLAEALLAYVTGSAYVPAAASVDFSSGDSRLRVFVEKRVLKSDRLPILERDTTVVVPAGPFPVHNSGTGKINSFYQNDHLSLCLNDENGRGLWGVPFKQPLCGYVESIDYYANGKIQFLFAAGQSLYLIDRLGRFVGGFPVDLGKPVLLGPQAYDFTGAHGYTVMVLHKDNTLEMYNLHGKKPDGWKGIHAPETVKSLPELVEVKGKRYWAVRTSVRTLVYGFEGGEPLTRETGGKMIRPDSQLTPVSRGLTVDCYDGKSRDIKLVN